MFVPVRGWTTPAEGPGEGWRGAQNGSGEGQHGKRASGCIDPETGDYCNREGISEREMGGSFEWEGGLLVYTQIFEGVGHLCDWLEEKKWKYRGTIEKSGFYNFPLQSINVFKKWKDIDL